MNPVDPDELTALLDGELPAQRAEEVRGALAAAPSLANKFEQLVELDAEWKASAARLMFRPRASLRRGLYRRFLHATGLVLGLVGLRLGLKLALPSLEIVVALAVFAVVAGWGVGYLLRRSEEDCWWLVRRPVAPTA